MWIFNIGLEELSPSTLGRLVTSDSLDHNLGSISGGREQRHAQRQVDAIFNFFDTDGSGQIEYREFVQALALISKRISPSSQMMLAFLMYDENGNGKVRVDTLRKAIDDAFAEPTVERFGTSDAVMAMKSFRSSHRHAQDPPVASYSSQVSDTLLGPASSSRGDEYLSFEEFKRLVEKHPEVLEYAMARMRDRLGFGEMDGGSDSDRADSSGSGSGSETP
eukprot:TRINITY_DN41166_c0_g1_i2.p1 TRINITY_DN41166_c0_g1~~TRINITY_DN41166_c0_g1_i2.p1  ORF type:complete len:236 (+),score=52.95 TRINITY_DN41166_c0_g1_i2:50-709(+)